MTTRTQNLKDILDTTYSHAKCVWYRYNTHKFKLIYKQLYTGGGQHIIQVKFESDFRSIAGRYTPAQICSAILEMFEKLPNDEEKFNMLECNRSTHWNYVCEFTKEENDIVFDNMIFKEKYYDELVQFLSRSYVKNAND